MCELALDWPFVGRQPASQAAKHFAMSMLVRNEMDDAIESDLLNFMASMLKGRSTVVWRMEVEE